MGMRITTNVSALNAQRNLIGSQREISKSMAQMSSGSRINKSADDAAGLAISESLKSQVRSAVQARRNANDAISMIQTAEGGVNEISNIIVRLRELGIQAASDTVGDTERGFLNKEVVQLKEEMNRIANVTSWGTTNLLNGQGPKFEFQVGLYGGADDNRISFSASDIDVSIGTLGLDGVDFSTKEGAQEALALLDASQSTVNSNRSMLGAFQNRLVSTSDNLAIQEENLSAANSRIRDTDVAQASSEMMRNQILLQASASTLAQANQTSNLALKLIG
ncbi:MAG: flagellin FliC [Bdellovibrionaceae bacterium]|nr:flagellin FliC [Pseudobdellovibrionaceae bacterium]MBX3033776.1 flagellin FliC [Pseudobdellovibrionaceae bacterium]